MTTIIDGSGSADFATPLPVAEGGTGGTSAVMPVGTIIDFAGAAAAVPTGFLVCPLTATTISRSTYSDLFDVIGTLWGAGDGSTTFGLPWFAADYAGVQANGNVGSATTGQNLAHTHTSFVAGSNSTSGSFGTNTVSGNTGSSGGAANLPAGSRVLKCIKY